MDGSDSCATLRLCLTLPNYLSILLKNLSGKSYYMHILLQLNKKRERLDMGFFISSARKMKAVRLNVFRPDCSNALDSFTKTTQDKVKKIYL